MRELTKEDFQSNIKGSCIVDFWAPWCGPCKMQTPILEQVDKEQKNVEIFKVNVDEHPGLASDYNVRGIPMLIFFKNGQIIDQHSGVMDKTALGAKIKQHFS